MQNQIEFTAADLDLPNTEPEKLAEVVLAMSDGKTPVRTLDVANALGRHYHTVKSHLHVAGKRGLLRRVPRKGWLPPDAA